MPTSTPARVCNSLGGMHVSTCGYRPQYPAGIYEDCVAAPYWGPPGDINVYHVSSGGGPDAPDANRPGWTVPMATTSRSETALLLERYASTGDEQARERLVVKYVPLVRSISNRYAGRRESADDLFQVGMVGLLNAIDKFDPLRGNSFAALAIPEVRGAVLNHLRDHGSLIKVPRPLQKLRVTVERASEWIAPQLGRWPTTREVAEVCGLPEEDVLAAKKLVRQEMPGSLDRPIDGGDGDITATLGDVLGEEDKRYEMGLVRMVLRSVLQRLTLREQRIVTLRYGHGMTQRQTAEVIAVSQMHVSRLERGALVKMREFMGPETTGDRTTKPARSPAA